MHTPPRPFEYFKFQYSKNTNGSRFTHTVIDKLPQLSYRFAEGSNWKATDYRITAQKDAIYKWFEGYWDNKSNSNFLDNQTLYERDLEQAILNAYEEVNKKWTAKLEKELEENFDEKVLGFLSGANAKK
jgi:hypothetical protein